MNTIHWFRKILLAAILLGTILAVSGCFNSGPPPEQTQSLEESQLLSRIPLKYDKLHWFLDESERPALESVHRKYQRQLKNWFDENGEAAFAFEADSKYPPDQFANRPIAAKLGLAIQAIQDEYEKAVVASAPFEKFKHWQADKLYRTVLKTFEPLELTNKQKKQIRDLAPNALQQNADRDLDSWLKTGTSKLEAATKVRVLNSDQTSVLVKLQANRRSALR